MEASIEEDGTTRPDDAGARPRDGGFSVIELVLTIFLVATTLIPLMDATITSIRASSIAREAAEIETVLANAADRVNRAPAQCDYLVYGQAAARSKGWDASSVSMTYQYYVPGASARATDPGTWANGACPGSTRTPRLMQLVTITITSPSGDVSRTMKVVKSDV